MNILTFDIEEWFHCDFISDNSSWNNYEVRIHSNTDFILKTLDNYNRKATFFILGWIAQKYPEIVLKIHNQGHEIGSHSMHHNLVPSLTPSEFRDDTYKSISILEDIISKKVIMYRAPGFSITENSIWAFDILLELGITHDASIFPANHDYGGFKSIGLCKPSLIKINGGLIKEFPMNVISFLNYPIVFSGGGFFRLLPYNIIKYFSNISEYTMIYFHPRDFDSLQPMLKNLPLMRKFKSYYGLKGASNKFNRWLNDFTTDSILNISNIIDWDSSSPLNINQFRK